MHSVEKILLQFIPPLVKKLNILPGHLLLFHIARLKISIHNILLIHFCQSKNIVTF